MVSERETSLDAWDADLEAPGVVPAVTAEQMGAVDRLMMEDIGVSVAALMEIAGWSVARFARQRFLDGDAAGKRVVVLAGSGNNGGDALVAGRHLIAWGASVIAYLTKPVDGLRGLPAEQADALHLAGGDIQAEEGLDRDLARSDLVLDGVLGFGISRAPMGAAARYIAAANRSGKPILAIDVPSGLDATTGEVFQPCIRATATLTLALPKTGLASAAARAVTGPVWVGDIGVPPAVYERLGIAVGPIFRRGSYLRWSPD